MFQNPNYPAGTRDSDFASEPVMPEWADLTTEQQAEISDTFWNANGNDTLTHLDDRTISIDTLRKRWIEHRSEAMAKLVRYGEARGD